MADSEIIFYFIWIFAGKLNLPCPHFGVCQQFYMHSYVWMSVCLSTQIIFALVTSTLWWRQIIILSVCACNKSGLISTLFLSLTLNIIKNIFPLMIGKIWRKTNFQGLFHMCKCDILHPSRPSSIFFCFFFLSKISLCIDFVIVRFCYIYLLIRSGACALACVIMASLLFETFIINNMSSVTNNDECHVSF